MDNGKKIIFKEKADEMPGAITGDVVLIVQQTEHKVGPFTLVSGLGFK